jgi:uncharacterized protein YjbI with pentapeptide repeats
MRWIVPSSAIIAVLALGVWLWWPPGADADRSSELGATLIGGAVVAIAVLYLERQVSSEAERRELRLQLGLQNSLAGIDLRNRDLSGFHLAGKDFRGANLAGANLRGANLSGGNLRDATLNGADLRGAKLDETPLHPSETLFPSEDLYPGPIYPDATIQNTTFSKAKYDSDTKWPKHINPATVGAISRNKH